MADIVAGDVTCKVLSRRRVGADHYQDGALRRVEVEVLLTIDPGTTDSYPTGGIPLTSAFTEASGEHIDTGLDVTQAIKELGRGVLKISSGVTAGGDAFFNQSGATPATQVLVLRCTSNLPSITGTGIAVASATSITDSGNGFVTAGFQVGDWIAISGHTGAGAGTNGVARITAVAAGTLTVATTSMTADTAGESVTIQCFYRPNNMLSQFTNADVTLGGGPTGGADSTFTYTTTLVGFLRHTARAYTVTQ